MSRSSLKQTLMRRDKISSNEADILVEEAQEAFNEYLAESDFESAYNVCAEYFGLEPDFIDDLM